MKYLVVALLGVLLGAAAAGAVLYYNPLTARTAVPPGSPDLTLHYGLPGDALQFVAGSRVTLPSWPHGEDALWEETIASSALLAIVLRDDHGAPTAIATRLMAASRGTDLLLSGALVSDYWLLTVPDEGTMFLHADTNLWPFLKDTLVPVWYLNRPWNGPTDIRPTMGPGADGTGVMLGGTGRFAGAAGTAVEDYTLTALDRASHHVTATGQLDLRGLNPVVASGD
jgi:hypothetical protein